MGGARPKAASPSVPGLNPVHTKQRPPKS
uniref:Uncharacterized protein n=1 Tax=Arundo donax TaxID=35708 RepID=A0A0A8YP02_ARUDO